MSSCSSAKRSPLGEPAADLVVDRVVAGQARERAGRALLLAPLEDVADAQHELAAVPRLGDVVVRAALEPVNLRGDVRARGEHHDRDVAGAELGAHLPADVVAVEERHHDVEEHEVGQLGRDLLERLAPVVGLADLVVLELQLHAEHVPQRRFVFCDENSRLRHTLLPSGKADDRGLPPPLPLPNAATRVPGPGAAGGSRRPGLYRPVRAFACEVCENAHTPAGPCGTRRALRNAMPAGGSGAGAGPALAERQARGLERGGRVQLGARALAAREPPRPDERDHGRVVGAQARRGNAQRDPAALARLAERGAQRAVARDAAAQVQRARADVLDRAQALADERVDDGGLERGRDVGDELFRVGRLAASPSASSPRRS